MKLKILFTLVILFKLSKELEIDGNKVITAEIGKNNNNSSSKGLLNSLMKKGMKRVYPNKLIMYMERILTGSSKKGLTIKLVSFANQFEDSLEIITSFNESMLSKSSNTILEMINLVWSAASLTPSRTLCEMKKILSQYESEARKIVSTLSENIPELTVVVNEAIVNVAKETNTILEVVGNSGFLSIGLAKKINFIPLYKATQVLTNTISAASKTLLGDSRFAEPVIMEATAVLTFVLNILLIFVHGVNLCISTMLYTTFQYIPDNLNKGLLSFDSTIEGITGSINLVAKGTSNSLKIVLENLFNVTTSLNTALSDICGVFDGVTVGVQHITKNLSAKVSHAVVDILSILS